MALDHEQEAVPLIRTVKLRITFTAQNVSSLSRAVWSHHICLPKKRASGEWRFWWHSLLSQVNKTDSKHFYPSQQKLRGQPLTLSFFAYFFKKSLFFFFFLTDFQACRVTSIPNEDFSLWIQINTWVPKNFKWVGGLVTRRWENSLILTGRHRQIPHWQPWGFGLCLGSRIRHRDSFLSVNLFETRHTLPRDVTSVPFSPNRRGRHFCEIYFCQLVHQRIFICSLICFMNIVQVTQYSTFWSFIAQIYAPWLDGRKVQPQHGAPSFPV